MAREARSSMGPKAPRPRSGLGTIARRFDFVTGARFTLDLRLQYTTEMHA